MVSHVNDSFDFVNILKSVSIDDNEVAVSFDVTSMYTSVPIEESLLVLLDTLNNDASLNDRTPLSSLTIIEGVKLCLTTTYFTFLDVLYRQTEGVAMGSPVSPVVANLFLNRLETSALQTFAHPPRIWLRYVDDTFAIITASQVQAFLTCLNEQSTNIKFTMETENDDRNINFLDCHLSVGENKSFTVGIHRKPTHSDRYLQYESSHPYCIKRGIICTLADRVNKLCSDESTRYKELKRLKKVLLENGYPKRLIQKCLNPKDNPRNHEANNTQQSSPTRRNAVMIPYRTGTSDAIRKILRDYDIETFFRVDNTLQRHLMKAKDAIVPKHQTNCVYQIRCSQCPAEYIGQTCRQLQVRMAEHKRHTKYPPRNETERKKLEKDSAIALHAVTENHTIDFDNVRILQAGFRSYAERMCAEALEISAHPNCVNRTEGVKIPSIWIGLTSQLSRHKDCEQHQKPDRPYTLTDNVTHTQSNHSNIEATAS